MISPRPALFSILITASLISLSGCQGQNNVYGYDFDSARITYKISGYSEGSSEMIIKGDKQLIRNNIVQTRPDGTKNEINNLLIQVGEKSYTLDPKTKKGSVISNPFYSELQRLTPDQRRDKMILNAIRNESDAGEQAIVPKPEKTEQVAGQKCEYYSGKITKTCLWQGIALKTTASLPDFGIQTDTIATKVELNQPIADSEFEVPSDYQITELN
ncbi:hypothetical protein IT412_02595 [Candidatus Peregrinibacteria bacterium]|nr:hypothetical protein [Candidatus Peregrinibacteria bacterium]